MAVIFIGSIGSWLPIGVEALVDKKVTFHNILPNITTYFVSILLAGCIDYFLSKPPLAQVFRRVTLSINSEGLYPDLINEMLLLTAIKGFEICVLLNWPLTR